MENQEMTLTEKMQGMTEAEREAFIGRFAIMSILMEVPKSQWIGKLISLAKAYDQLHKEEMASKSE